MELESKRALRSLATEYSAEMQLIRVRRNDTGFFGGKPALSWGSLRGTLWGSCTKSHCAATKQPWKLHLEASSPSRLFVFVFVDVLQPGASSLPRVVIRANHWESLT
jgi:hypothetical protein